MLALSVLLRLFLVGFGLNFIWELAHCPLYETCRRQKWRQNIPLLIKMSVKDGFFIVLFFQITAYVWQTSNILLSPFALITFMTLALSFSFVDESISVRQGRWEYASAMPTLFGVGITPLLEIAITGLVANILLF